VRDYLTERAEGPVHEEEVQFAAVSEMRRHQPSYRVADYSDMWDMQLLSKVFYDPLAVFDNIL